MTIGQGLHHSLSADTMGNVWATGENTKGQLGLGHMLSPFLPSMIPGFSLFDGTDLQSDLDADGLTLFAEFLAGTDALVADTNGNGLLDGFEVAQGLDGASLDTDGDGLSNAAEVLAGTNPFSADTDGDGSADGVDQLPLDATRHLLTTTSGDAPVITLLRPLGAHPIQ